MKVSMQKVITPIDESDLSNEMPESKEVFTSNIFPIFIVTRIT